MQSVEVELEHLPFQENKLFSIKGTDINNTKALYASEAQIYRSILLPMYQIVQITLQVPNSQNISPKLFH